MSWFSKMFGARPADPPMRIEPECKSFFYANAPVAAPVEKAFDLLRGNNGAINYNQCPPLAIGLNRIVRATANLDYHYYSKQQIVASPKVDALIDGFKRSKDLAEVVRSVTCAGKAYVVMIGNSEFLPSRIASVSPADLGEIEDTNRNVTQIIVNGGRWQGTYNQVEYGSDLYRTSDSLRTILVIHNQFSEYPLSAVSAAIKTIVEGYNQNYKTIKTGGRLNQVWAFKDSLTEQETQARHVAANNRIAKGGVVVTSGGELDIKELGLTAKDMDWLNQLSECKQEIYNFLGVPLPLVTNDAATFANVATSSAMFYEHTVLPDADYIFGIIGAYLARLAKLQNVVMMADRENIDALLSKRLEQLKVRKEIGVETTNELRQSIAGREDVEGGDQLLVDARSVPIDQIVGGGT